MRRVGTGLGRKIVMRRETTKIKFFKGRNVLLIVLLLPFHTLIAAYEDHRNDILYELNFQDQDLTYDNFESQNLTGANLVNTNLTNAILRNTILTGADFTNAVIKGVNFDFVKTLTKDQIYSSASYKNKDLSGINFGQVDLSGIDFSRQNLSNIEFRWAVLSGVDFSDATIDGTSFRETTSYGFTKEQLYSTLNYKNKDLSKIGLNGNDLTGWDFTGQNLSNATLEYSTLTAAKFTDAIINGTDFSITTIKGFTKEQLYSTSNYKNHNLRGVKFGDNDLSGWDFSGQDLTNASFTYYQYSYYRQGNSNLTGANFSDAVINNVDFSDTIGLTEEQLYSTASYKNKDLSGVRLSSLDMSSWIFSGQNLTNADLTNADLSNAEFANARLTGTDLSGSTGFDGEAQGALLKNTILADGTIRNFSMDSAEDKFLIRNYYSQSSSYPDAGGISARISEASAKISGGAELALECGAQLKIINQKTLIVASDGTLVINTELADSYGMTLISVDSLSGLIFEDGASLFINVELRASLFDTGDYTSIVLLEWENDANIEGLSGFVKDENIFLTLGGKKFHGEWDYIIKNNQFMINMTQIPEPSAYAAILGFFAMLFAYKKRRSYFARKENKH